MSKSQSGFTLIELMITVTVVVVLTAIGYPSFAAMMRSTRLASSANNFQAAVSYARSEAIKNNAGATICASVDSLTCSGTAANWNTGWLVFDDVNDNGTIDGTDAVVRVGTFDVTNINFVITSATPPAKLTFNNRGVYTGTTAPVTFQMKPTGCPSGYQGLRTFNLLAVGQLTVVKGNCP